MVTRYGAAGPDQFGVRWPVRHGSGVYPRKAVHYDVSRKALKKVQRFLVGVHLAQIIFVRRSMLPAIPGPGLLFHLRDESKAGHRRRLAAIAVLAGGDQIPGDIPAAQFLRHDVIHMEHGYGRERSAVPASEVVAAEHLVAEALRDGHVVPCPSLDAAGLGAILMLHHADRSCVKRWPIDHDV